MKKNVIAVAFVVYIYKHHRQLFLDLGSLFMYFAIFLLSNGESQTLPIDWE